MSVSRKFMGLIVALCAGILPLTIALWPLNVLQTQNTKLFIEPPSIVYEALVLGKRFSINITVANTTDLKGYELKLNFNTAMLDVVAIVLLPEESLPIGDFAVDDSSGVMWMNVTYNGNSVTADKAVALASITFKMMNQGQSPLHLHDTKLMDSLGDPISHDTVDGMVLILRHDIAIIGVAPSTNVTYIGRTINVTVTAKNDGDLPENFTVKVYHNDTLLETFEVIDLAPSDNISIVFSWNTSDVAPGCNYTLKAEASIIPFETNITNNLIVDGEVKIKIVGDVNNDNEVDIEDLIAWDMAYGSREGLVNWNSQADINGDGVVNNEDGILIVQNYHTTA